MLHTIAVLTRLSGRADPRQGMQPKSGNISGYDDGFKICHTMLCTVYGKCR